MSRNAIRHGLTGTQIVATGEDPAAYEGLQQGRHESHRPAIEAERILIDQIAPNAWRLMRAQRVETAFPAKLIEGAKDPAAAQNAYYKAMTQLAKLQKDRALTEQTREPVSGIGFVSYSARAPRFQPQPSVNFSPEPHFPLTTTHQ